MAKSKNIITLPYIVVAGDYYKLQDDLNEKAALGYRVVSMLQQRVDIIVVVMEHESVGGGHCKCEGDAPAELVINELELSEAPKGKIDLTPDAKE